ncbi:MAG: hypothetical protein ACIALR_05435 [Blastopirellula sp. JB062]
MAKDNRPLRLSDIHRPELGEGENNPFSERHDPAPSQEPNFSAGETYRAGEFETTVGHRGGFLLLIGATSLVVAIGPLVGAYFSAEDRILLLVIQPFLGLLFGMPSWLMARGDLRAMQSGAMDRSGLKRTKTAMWLGAVATASVAGLFVVLIFRLFASALGFSI